jgi:predicted GIY-YIG superfamily endonuclease
MPPFHYVYLLQSTPRPTRHYTGLTTNLSARLAKHNAGGNPHTSVDRPWSINTAIAFRDAARAAGFERYLKSPSGRAFARKRL